jgi:hypothetical protein
MANTFELISSYTASGSVASIGFSSIPSTYTDLCIKLSLRSSNTTGTYDPVKININSNGTNMLVRDIYGTSSSAGSEAPGSPDNVIISYTSNANNTANTFGNLEIYIPNYANASYTKSMSADGISETNGSGSILVLTSGLWNSTSAINEITVFPYSGNFVQYSTAYLYGIKNS